MALHTEQVAGVEDTWSQVKSQPLYFYIGSYFVDRRVLTKTMTVFKYNNFNSDINSLRKNIKCIC
jgi:hypothetical protein